MRKLFILIGLFLTLSLSGQSLLSGVVASQGGAVSPYCAEYTTVYNAMTNKPSATNAGYQNTLVVDLKAAGTWTKFDIFYVFAQESNSASEALICWTSPTGDDNGTNVSSTAWTTLEGFTGDGTADYINTNFTPSSEGVNYVQNSASIGIYLRVANDNALTVIGATNSSTFEEARINPYFGDANMYGLLNVVSGLITANATGSAGLFVTSRRSSTDCENYKNGGSLGSGSNTSAAVPNTVFNVLKRGSTAAYSDNQASIVFIGAGLSDTEVADTNTAIEKYMDAIGKGVQ